ncbi:metalloprotease family protein [Clostridioides difficile]|nr:metalloprotease family protein [Clostridioides difficile]
MSKCRFLIVSIMPFVLLSIILSILLNILGVISEYTILLCLINALGSCVDLLNICLISIQVPSKYYIKINRFETYFNQK